MADYLLQHQLENSARKYPESTAVAFGEESLTYRELDSLTNRVARELIRVGVRRGDRVGIYVNKSLSSVVSIYGILKAGAVYVPLDPQSPVERITYIVNNCNIGCILTSTAKIKPIQEILKGADGLRTLFFMDSKAELPDLPAQILELEKIDIDGDVEPPGLHVIETDLAYILYTSGSTGAPKGVMISHLNALTFVRWVCDTFDLQAEDRLSNHAPLHFDLSILDIFCAARAGAAVFPVPESLSLFPVRLAAWIEKNEISVWYSVPSILSMLVLHGKLEEYRFEKLRMVFYAGEVFPVKYLRQLMTSISQAECVNLYGPTETNVITYYRTPVLPEDRTKPVPIGIRCENMDVFIVDGDGKEISEPGIEGELMARGSNVAMGYWGDKKKTDQCFVQNPHQPAFRERMYKTGDLVMLDDSGDIIFMGRRDHMIKSRGYRIEIGEIESALYSCSDIREAAVIAIPDDLITNRIKAFIVLQEEVAELSASDIRSICAQKVPKYMVPEIIEFRESLPKTSTGKVNKPDLVKESTTPEFVIS